VVIVLEVTHHTNFAFCFVLADFAPCHAGLADILEILVQRILGEFWIVYIRSLKIFKILIFSIGILNILVIFIFSIEIFRNFWIFHFWWWNNFFQVILAHALCACRWVTLFPVSAISRVRRTWGWWLRRRAVSLALCASFRAFEANVMIHFFGIFR